MENIVYEMLTTSTGSALCDSGDAYGRHWERNQKRSMGEFKNEPEISFKIPEDATISKEIEYTISVFHYLTKQLDLDQLCDEFNALPCKEWDGDIYGVSSKQEKWLEKKGLKTVGNSWNTYNSESSLSQNLQGVYLSSDGTDIPDYALIQIHQGCDIRVGYTDAKLFKLENEYLSEVIYGTVENNGETVDIDNQYDGINLTDEDGNGVPITSDSKITLSLGY